jgi:TP901 family phage tail tape measure protein
MASIGAMSLILSADPGKMQKGLSQGIASMANFGTAAASMAASVAAGLGGMFTGVASSAASFLEIKTSLADITRVGIDFERQMSIVGAMTGAVGDKFNDLREEARRLGRDTEFTAEQAASAMSQLAQHGFNPADIMEGTKSVVALASVLKVDIPQAAIIASDAVGGFGLHAADLERVNDVIASMLTGANTGGADAIQDAFKYVATTAQVAGKSIEETSAALMVLNNAGIKGSEAGSALSRFMTKMAKQTPAAQAALDKLNVSFEENGKFRDFGAIFDDLHRELAKLGEFERIELVSRIFDVRAGRAAAVFGGLKSSAAEYRKNVERLKGAGGTASTIAAKQIDNVWGAIKIVQSSWEGFVEKVYATIMSGPLRQGIDALTQFINGVSKGFNELAGELAAAFSAEGGAGVAKDLQKAWHDVGAGIGPALAGIVRHMAPLLRTTAQWFTDVMKGGGVIRQFGNILSTLISNLGQLAQFLGGTGGPLGNLLPNKDQILEGLIAIEYGLKTLGPAAELSTLKMHLAIRENLLDPIENTGRFMVAWKDYMIDAWTDLADGMVFVMQGATGIIADTIHSLGASIVKFLQDPSQGFQFNMPGIDKVSRAFRSMTAPPPMWGDFGGESSDTAGLRARAEELGTSINNGFWDHMNARKKELAEAGQEIGGGVLAGIGGDIMGAAGAGIAGVLGDLNKPAGGGSGGQGEEMKAFEVKMAEAVMAGSAEAISLANKFRLERDIGGGKKSVEDQQLEVQKKMLEELKGKGGAVVSIG